MRQTGRTTAICKAAKDIDGTVVAASARHARMIAMEHDVKTISMNQSDQMIGMDTPFLWDHFTVECMMAKHEAAIHDKNKKIKRLEATIQRMKAHRENQSSE